MTFADRIRVFGLVVESELPLASTEPYRGGSATDVRIEVADAAYFRVHAPVVEPAPADWVTHVVCRDGRVYLKAENVFEAIVAADGRTVTCRTLGETDARSVEANLLNFALSTCLTLRGAALARTLIASAMDDHNAEPQRLQRQLAFVSRIATTIPVFSLRYRREFKVMPKVADTIERLP